MRIKIAIWAFAHAPWDMDVEREWWQSEVFVKHLAWALAKTAKLRPITDWTRGLYEKLPHKQSQAHQIHQAFSN